MGPTHAGYLLDTQDHMKTSDFHTTTDTRLACFEGINKVGLLSSVVDCIFGFVLRKEGVMIVTLPLNPADLLSCRAGNVFTRIVTRFTQA
eukprot:6077341-Amphidinium_carterae.2